MSSGQKTVSAFLGLICGLLIVILGLCLSWPIWMWLGALALLLAVWTAVTTIMARVRRRDPFPPGTLIDQPAPPVVERRELRIDRIPLPSQLPDYDFLFSARIRWCPVDPTIGDQLVNPGALAVETVLARAREIAGTLDPSRSALAQHELNGALGVMAPNREGHVRAMALDVLLRLTDEDQERLDRLAAIRKDEAVWEHQRRYEQNKREYLGTDVLTSTGSAVVWWLAKNDDHVEKTVKDLGLLAQLSSAANNTDVAEPFRHLVPEAFPPPVETPRSGFAPADEAVPGALQVPDAADLIVEAFRLAGFSPGGDETALIGEQLARAFARKDSMAAEEIRRRFGDRQAPSYPGTSTNGVGPAANSAEESSGVF